MINIRFILLVIAAILFLLAALNLDSPRINLTAAGLFCWVMATLV